MRICWYRWKAIPVRDFSRVAIAAVAIVFAIPASADLGLLSWGALTPQNRTAAGRTLYGGDGTYYGQQGNQNSGGVCSYGSAKSNTLDLEWTSDIQNTVALNADQFQQGLACGTCLYYRGTGGGVGTTPLPSDWQFAFVDNMCPECAFGSIDLNLNGDGRWNVEWFPAPCDVSNDTFKYVNPGVSTNPYWFEFTVSNTRVPVKKVEMLSGGEWGEMRRTFNNMYAANGGPFETWPLPLRITSMLNDTVYDMLSSAAGGLGTAQFPDRGPAVFPQEGVIAETVSGLRSAQIPAPPAPPVPQLGPTTSPKEATPLAPAPAPSSLPVLGDGSIKSLTLVAYTVPNEGQCGGNSFFCSKLVPNQCKDGVWEQAQCNPEYTCQRTNASWWSCIAAEGATLGSSYPPSLTTTPPNLPQLPQAPRSRLSPTVSQPASSQNPATAASLVPPIYPPKAASGVAAPQLASAGSQNPAAALRTVPVRDGNAPQVAGMMPVSQPPSDQPDGGSSFPVVAMGQCGGSTSYCASLAGNQCKDSPWDGAQCPPNYSCQRWNNGWWQCSPIGKDIQAVSTAGRKLAF